MYILGAIYFLKDVDLHSPNALTLAYSLMLIGLLFSGIAAYQANKLRKIRKAKCL